MIATRQALALHACAARLGALRGQLNHHAAPWALSFTLPGLLLTLPALRLPWRAGLATAFLSGLWLDAAAPVAFGRHAFLFAFLFCLLHRVRDRLPRGETLVRVVTALFVNLAVFVALAFLQLGSLPDTAAGGLRLLADLIVSQLLTVLIGPWFFALQEKSLELLRATPSTPVGRYA
jgi:rod shape-determining protein MreD